MARLRKGDTALGTATTSQTGKTRGFGTSGILLTQVVNLMFALNTVGTKVVVDATAPLLAVLLRMGAVFAICAVGFRLVPGRNRMLAAYGFLNGGLFLLLMNFAMRMAHNVPALAIAGQLSVPFSLVLGALLLHERLSRAKVGGVLLAFAGVALLVFDRRIVDDVPAMLIMMAAAMTWGGATLLQRQLDGIGVLNIQAWNGLMGALAVAPFALWVDHDHFDRALQMGWVAGGWFAFMVLGSTVLGQGLLAWLLQRHPVATIMPLTLASPVMSTAFAALYFGTPITPVMIAGGLLALAGVSMIALAGKAPAEPANTSPCSRA